MDFQGCMLYHEAWQVQSTCDAVGEDVLPDVHVHSRERVVHDVQVSASVRSARHADALLLAAAQVDTFLPNLCAIPCWQNLHAGYVLSALLRGFP